MIPKAFALPYYAPPAILPQNLPSQEEMCHSSEVYSETSGRKVVGVGPFFVAKYGLQVDLGEGRNIIYVAEHTSTPVPRVYALFQDPESKRNFIIMERIHGQSLDKAWLTLTPSQKQEISGKLQTMVGLWRKAPSPGRFCNLDGLPLSDALFWKGTGDDPFRNDEVYNDEEDLNKALIRNYALNDHLRGKGKFYELAFPHIFRGHEPVFTHGDLQRKNVLVTTNSSTGEVVLTMIDWEFAGWYPSYWEFTKALFACGRFEDGWSHWLLQILEPFWTEYSWLNTMMYELWG